MTKATLNPADEPESCKIVPPPGPRIPNVPRIRKISRPPRRTHSREDKLIDALTKTEETFQKRLDAMDEVEKRNEKRDDTVASSMTRFLNAFAILAENSAKHITPSFPLGVPLTNIHNNYHENTATTPVVEKKIRSSIVENDIQTPFITTLSSVKRRNHGKSTSSTSSMASSVLQPQDPDKYHISDVNAYIDADHIVENVDVTDSLPSEPLDSYELEHFDSFLANMDNDMDSLPEFPQANRADKKEKGVDPVFEFIKSEINSSVLEKPNKSKRPRIVSNEYLQQKFNVKQGFVRAQPYISANPSIVTGPSTTYMFSKQRAKSGSIIVSKDNCQI